MKAKNDAPMVNVNVRITQETADLIGKAISESGQDKSEIMRRALAIGLDEMARVGFDVEAVYRQAIAESRGMQSDHLDALHSLPPPGLVRTVKKA